MEAVYAVFGLDWLYEQLLYQLLIYQSLDTYELQENQTVEEIVYLLKGCEVGPGLKIIERILERCPQLQDNTISNISWQDYDKNGEQNYSPDGLQACIFQNHNTNICSLVFRGTPRGAWLDNAKMLIGDTDYCRPFTDLAGRQWNYLSPMQAEAMEYIKGLIESSGEEWHQSGTRHYVAGHSKGGNQAQLAMIIYPYYFEAGLSMNGPGVSAAMLEEIRQFIGEDLEPMLKWRLFALNASNDVVSELGYSLVPSDQTYWSQEDDCEVSVLCNHSLNSLFDKENADLAPLTETRGPAAAFAERLFLEAMELDVKDRASLFMTLMGILQVVLGKSMPVNAGHENWFRFIAGLDDGTIEAIQLMVSVLFDTDEGRLFMEYKDSLQPQHQ